MRQSRNRAKASEHVFGALTDCEDWKLHQDGAARGWAGREAPPRAPRLTILDVAGSSGAGRVDVGSPDPGSREIRAKTRSALTNNGVFSEESAPSIESRRGKPHTAACALYSAMKPD